MIPFVLLLFFLFPSITTVVYLFLKTDMPIKEDLATTEQKSTLLSCSCISVVIIYQICI